MLKEMLLAKITILSICLLNHLTNAFNLDTVNYVHHEGEPNSMFGFSVVLHEEQGRGWAVIGAPKADNSRYQENVINGGNVVRCDAIDDNRCQIIHFDKNSDRYNERNEKISTKSHQWFGATVVSAGKNGPIMACAPRYVFHTFTPRKIEKNEPVGTCYMARQNFADVVEISPCRTNNWGYHRQGSCQAGFSAAISRSGDRLFIGAPGSWYWQGQTYSYNPHNLQDRVYSTLESPSTDDDSYLGYSSVSGNFDYDSIPDVAVGMPRGSGLLGKIVLMTFNLTNIKNISGEQIGGYFGYSLTVSDVDGDRKDDLIVGAPMFTPTNNEQKYDVGRVYIYYQGQDRQFTNRHTRDGIKSKSRFGLAVANLGDINLDSYGDFAVGAPYDGVNERGCVYIYHGSANGVLEKPSQILDAESFPDARYLKTFGFSISGGIDLDGNQYPDLVVGAYESSRALVFKSRPVIVVEATTQLTAENKLISLEDKNCQIPGTRNYAVCTQVNSCLKYHGTNVPQELILVTTWVLDAKKSRAPRMYFLSDPNKNLMTTNITLNRGRMECRSHKVYIDNVKDKLTPLEVEMKFKLPESAYASTIRQPRSEPQPVLDMNIGTMTADSINIQKNCGPDNICIPDLRLAVNTVDKYLLGSKELLKIEVAVSNYGEDAFEAGFYMNVPPELNLKRTERISTQSDQAVTCTAPSLQNNYTLKCDIGNPLPKNSEVKFNVILDPSKKATSHPSYSLIMVANSTNPELDHTDFNNKVTRNIAIMIETNLTIYGNSVPDKKILYNATDYLDATNATTEAEIGPQMVHIYNIHNSGPSRIEEAEIYILWPYVTKHDREEDQKVFVYLLNEPETSGNIRCERAPFVNDFNLQIDSQLASKSYLELAGVARKDSGSYAYQVQQKQQTTRNRTQFSFDDRSSSGDASKIHEERSKWAYTDQGGSKSSFDVLPPPTLVTDRWDGYGGSASKVDQWGSSGGATGGRSSGESKTSHWESKTYGTYGGGSSGDSRTGGQWHSSDSYGGSRSGGGSTSGSYDGARISGGSSSHEGSRVVGGSSSGTFDSRRISGGRSSGVFDSGRVSGGSSSGAFDSGRVSGGSFDSDRVSGGSTSGSTRTSSSRWELSDSSYDGGRVGGGSTSGSTNGRWETSGSYGGGRAGTGGDAITQVLDLGTGPLIGGGASGGQTSTSDVRISSSGGQYGSGEQRYGGSGSIRYGGSASTGGQYGGAGGQYGSSEVRYSSGSDPRELSKGSESSYSRQWSSSSGGEGDRSRTFSSGSEMSGGRNHTFSSSSHWTGSRSGSVGGGGSSSTGHNINYIQNNDKDYDDPSRLQHYRTYNKREANPDPLQDAFQCNPLFRCARMKCTVGPLENNDDAYIALRTRLVINTLTQISTEPVQFSTMMVGRVTKLPYTDNPQNEPVKKYEIVNTAEPFRTPKEDIIPLWVIILAALAGLLLLLLLILLLYKCGFFKRNRPARSPETTPLKKAAYGHNDEHL